jgi:HK97 family phage prohead protease
VSELIIERAVAAFEPVGDGWTVYGRAVWFDVPQRVTDDGVEFYQEVFDPAAFDRDVAKGGRWVNLMAGHRGDDGERFLGRAMRLDALPDGLYAEVRLDRSNPLADQARAGELTGWSIGARVYKTTLQPDGTRRRLACGLNHIAATASPQYAGAGVLTYRSEHVQETLVTPLLDAWRARYSHR